MSGPSGNRRHGLFTEEVTSGPDPAPRCRASDGADVVGVPRPARLFHRPSLALALAIDARCGHPHRPPLLSGQACDPPASPGFVLQRRALGPPGRRGISQHALRLRVRSRLLVANLSPGQLLTCTRSAHRLLQSPLPGPPLHRCHRRGGSRIWGRPAGPEALAAVASRPEGGPALPDRCQEEPHVLARRAVPYIWRRARWSGRRPIGPFTRARSGR
jgi:hypothetical protein